MNWSEKPNVSLKNMQDRLISLTNSCGSAQTIVALDGGKFALRVVPESPAFSACQLLKPCSLATLLCESLSSKLAARIPASAIFEKPGSSPRICAATG